MKRRDYAFPFRIDSASRGGAQAASYAAHVEEMIRQILLTSPGERADLPTFGCGLRRLLFAPNSDAVAITTKIIVAEALGRWLAGQIEVKAVVVVTTEEPADENQVLIRVEYVLIETRESQRVEVLVS